MTTDILDEATRLRVIAAHQHAINHLSQQRIDSTHWAECYQAHPYCLLRQLADLTDRVLVDRRELGELLLYAMNHAMWPTPPTGDVRLRIAQALERQGMADRVRSDL